MTIIITMLAFIINVGLFVKAKINMQNAVDAAAWSGAAVQARQLTNIGYLNWEMRNNYKEWMFKNYVLGQVALGTVANTDSTNNNGSATNMQFRAKPFDPANSPLEFERFNLPSICIHFGTGHNICDLLRLPGLPRFNTVGLPSISAQHESVLSALVKTKANDCSRRTNVNFGAALLWAYGTGSAEGLNFQQMPLIASSRVGAWMKSMELGIRMRNLEAQVNRPPLTDGICFQCETGAAIDTLDGKYPANERPIKAFWSAFRNLTEGNPSSSNNQDEISSSFVLTELAPTKTEFTGSKTLSNYLIPASSNIAGLGYDPAVKYYLDLQAYPINFVTFFTTFVSRTGNFNNTGVAQEGDCGGSKTGLPVPGFMFGYVKNPKLMTYYAVKGEARFVGLFNPFTDGEGIKIKAYAAAKPFGGRIGPKLFNIDEGNQIITPRKESSSNRSAAYVSSLKIPPSMRAAPIKDKYRPGIPIPLTEGFWVESSLNPIGGTPDSGDVYFAIPNLLYEYTGSGMDAQVQSGLLNDIKLAESQTDSLSPHESLGLHSKDQFNAFKDNYQGSFDSGAIISQDQIEHSINLARRATKYDAANYLVPVIHDESVKELVENISNARAEPPENCNIPPASNPPACVRLYAPLYGDGTMYATPQLLTEVITETVDRFKPAVKKFVDALEDVHDSLKAQDSRDPGTYVEAAETIFKPGGLPSGADPVTLVCQSAALSQNFFHFFNGTAKACGITPIVDLIGEYFLGTSTDPTYIINPMAGPSKEPTDQLMTAYMPGERQGAQSDGSIPSAGPLSTSAESLIARRNFYSTKFVPLELLVSGGYAKGGQWMLIERGLTNPPQDTPNVITNTLKASDLAEWDKLFF